MPVPANTPLGPDIKTMNYMQLESNSLLIPPLSSADFENSLKKNKPSVGKD